MKTSKRALLCAMALAVLLSFTACMLPLDSKLSSLGSYKKKEFYSNDGFQDYTDYAKYFYDSVDVSDNPYFSAVDEEGMALLNEYLDNFEEWVSVTDPETDVAKFYDFDRGLIDTEDYYYIYDREGEPIGHASYDRFDSYNVYFLDIQTNTVYYFHNNI